MGRREPAGAGGPLEVYAAGFQVELERRGYAPVSVRHRVTQLMQLSRWMRRVGLAVGELDDVHAARFVAARRAEGRVTWVSRSSVELPLGYLRGVGAAPDAGTARAGSLEHHLGHHLGDHLGEYRGYLVHERVLAADTIRAYLRVADSFFRDVDQRHGDEGLGRLRASDVTRFVVVVCAGSSVPSAKKTVTALASLLRYLHVVGVTDRPLADALPTVAGHRRAGVAGELAAADVARLLSSCDRRRDVGRRDYAILMLLCRLGLRAGEVAALTLEDVDWRHGEILIRGKGGREEVLPLPADVGEAVACYLSGAHRRVPTGCRAVFVQIVAPEGPLKTSGVRNVVSRAALRAGLPAMGPHLLRHAAATELLRQGAGLPEVAQVLRHRQLQVTAGYTAVAPPALRELARPWPSIPGEPSGQVRDE